MIKGLYLLDSDPYDLIYGPEERQAIHEMAELTCPPQTRQMVANSPVAYPGGGRVDCSHGGNKYLVGGHAIATEPIGGGA